ncbi:methyltransferase domain-containing protein [Niallia oryzisoli]|uniref:Methyltransferase domain-containing protein n=1 Tax=Niallia oryzisoli TaxID=1737571 RepID=A0ABZ2CBM0_9BACI
MLTKVGMLIIGTAKQTVKRHQSSKNIIIRSGISGFYQLWNTVQTLRRVCVDKEFRSILLLQLLNSKNVHQTTPLTFMNRYPEIFSACRDYFGDKQDIKILSYGCSTGEEVLTLRQYFPNAQIVGAEINKNSLAICRNLKVDEKIKFIHSTSQEIEKYGPFDAIFCMAVLQRKPHYIKAKGVTSLKKIYPFEKFEQQIVELDHLVNPQGLMVVHFTQYSVVDTKVASKYEPLGDFNQDDYESPVFDRNSNLVINPSSQKSIFVKQRD